MHEVTGDVCCRAWDIRSGSLAKVLDTGKEVTSIEVSQDGRHITTADGREVTFLTSAQTKSSFESTSHAQMNYIVILSWYQSREAVNDIIKCFLVVGRQVQSIMFTLCVSVRGWLQVRFWDGERLEQVKSYSQPYDVESASYCPEKGRFVAGGGDMWAHLHDYDTGAELESNRGERVGCQACISTCMVSFTLSALHARTQVPASDAPAVSRAQSSMCVCKAALGKNMRWNRSGQNTT